MADSLEVQNEEDVLGLSDEDILNLPEPTINTEEPADDGQETEEEEIEEANEVQEEEEEDVIDEGPVNEEIGEPDEEDDEGDPEATQENEVIAAKPARKTKKSKKGEPAEGQEVSVQVSADDMLKELFTPFKANGKEISVGSIADAKTLMQMGANYNKKMAGLKPNLKLMKMLSNNDLLDEQKLSYLIDLSNKNPKAISQLIKDSGVDPLEIDTESSTKYKPSSYTVNDNEVDLDQVLMDIQDTPSFDKTIDIISNKWDDSSKKVLLDTPSLITTINDHVASGIYGEISNIIEQERTLGRLTELSDLEAYKHVGDVLQKQGAFNQQPQAQQPVPITQQAQAKQDPKLNDKRRAASGTKKKAIKKSNTNYNPLELSDEEFMKVARAI